MSMTPVLPPADRPWPRLSRNCPFYGRHLFARANPEIGTVPFLLIDSHGNQCGLVTGAHSPCSMEIAHATPEWSECPRVSEITSRRA